MLPLTVLGFRLRMLSSKLYKKGAIKRTCLFLPPYKVELYAAQAVYLTGW